MAVERDVLVQSQAAVVYHDIAHGSPKESSRWDGLPVAKCMATMKHRAYPSAKGLRRSELRRRWYPVAEQCPSADGARTVIGVSRRIARHVEDDDARHRFRKLHGRNRSLVVRVNGYAA